MTRDNGVQDISRRTAIKTTGAIFTGAALAGCVGGGGSGGTNSSSGKSDSIRYLGWGGNTQKSAQKLFDEWSKQSGVDVKYQSAGGDSEFISIIKQNPGSIDFVNFSSNGIAVAREEDMLAQIDYSKVPNYTKNIQKDYRNISYITGHKDTIFRDPVTQGFAVNTNQVETVPKSWKDLKSKQFHNNLALRDDALSRLSNSALATGSNITQMVKDGPGSKTWQNAINHQKALDANVVKYWGSGAQAIQLLREKNVIVAEIWGGRTLALQDAGYDQMEYVIPTEGATTADENYNIPKSSENADAVLDLLNWSYQRDNAIQLSTDLSYPIPITNPPSEISNLPDYVKNTDQLSWPDYSVVIPKLSQLQVAFQKTKQ